VTVFRYRSGAGIENIHGKVPVVQTVSVDEGGADSIDLGDRLLQPCRGPRSLVLANVVGTG